LVRRKCGAHSRRGGDSDRLSRTSSRPELSGPSCKGRMWPRVQDQVTSGSARPRQSIRLRKSRNLASNPRCALSVSLDDIDVVVEGTARKVTDPAILERVANHYASRGWPARASDGAITAEYSAPSAGRGPWDLSTKSLRMLRSESRPENRMGRRAGGSIPRSDLVGRGGLEPHTSAVRGPERCA